MRHWRLGPPGSCPGDRPSPTAYDDRSDNHRSASDGRGPDHGSPADDATPNHDSGADYHGRTEYHRDADDGEIPAHYDRASHHHDRAGPADTH